MQSNIFSGVVKIGNLVLSSHKDQYFFYSLTPYDVNILISNQLKLFTGTDENSGGKFIRGYDAIFRLFLRINVV